MNYEASLKRKRDAESVRLTQERIGREKGMKEGLEKGLEKGKRVTALKMKEKGYPLEDIVELTGLSIEDIEKL